MSCKKGVREYAMMYVVKMRERLRTMTELHIKTWERHKRDKRKPEVES